MFFFVFSSPSDHSFAWFEKSREGFNVSWEFAPLMCFMFQMSFRRYSYNDPLESKHLSVVCKWLEMLIEFILPSLPIYNFWRVSFSLLWVIFHVLLLSPFLWCFYFMHLEKTVYTISQKSKEYVRASWTDSIYSLSISKFYPKGNLEVAFLDVVHLWIGVFWPLVRMIESAASMVITPSPFMSPFSRS